MQRLRGFNATQWTAVASGIVGIVAALATLLLGNPLTALVAATSAGGFVYLMERGGSSNSPERRT
ncbi:MAG: hypothetical protein QF652_01965 [Dehalococcoidia bacterium]|jgi:uncharacterized membrane protein HdeD (DUF308 family)|nr:hypothetical protein [Dehalococcoidia bacterium]